MALWLASWLVSAQIRLCLRLWVPLLLWLRVRNWISGRRDCASGSSHRRDRASDDRPKRGGIRKLLRDSREDVLAQGAGVDRDRLFLQGLRRPRAGNGRIEF